MTGLHRQQGWYNGAIMLTLVIVMVLFMAQPWIPLLLLAAAGSAAVVMGAARGGQRLRRWLQFHYPHWD